MELFKLFGKIVVENSEANENIDESTKKAQDSSESISGSFKKIGAAIATYITVDAIKEFGVTQRNRRTDIETHFNHVAHG